MMMMIKIPIDKRSRKDTDIKIQTDPVITFTHSFISLFNKCLFAYIKCEALFYQRYKDE